MFTRFIILIISLNATAWITGCDLLQPNPEQVLTKYLNAKQKGNIDAYDYISNADQAVKSSTEFYNQISSPFNEIDARLESFEILNVQSETITAKIEVEMITADYDAVIDLLDAKGLFEGIEDEAHLVSIINEEYSEVSIPTKKSREYFHLVKNDGDWKVFLDLASAEAKRVRNAKVFSLESDAFNLSLESDLDKELEIYQQIVSLYDGETELDDNFVLFEEKLKSLTKRKAYLVSNQVELFDLKAQYYSSYIDGEIPGVEFKLKNNGIHSLNRVVVIVYFMDDTGAIIAEHKYNPVLVTNTVYSDDTPLKPGYIWKQDHGHFYKAAKVPSEWKEGSVSAQIISVDFAD